VLAIMAFTLFAAPPETRTENVVETIHGVEVRDPYRWLEDSEAPEVKAWTVAQNRSLREQLDVVSSRKWLEERLWQWEETGYLLDRKNGGPAIPLVTGRDAIFSLAEVLNNRLHIMSNEQAPRYRLFKVDPENPERSQWKLVIPEAEDTLEQVVVAGDNLVGLYLRDVIAP
jgi:protease II